jgi:c-di-GMP-binding flagellar brake protein YcgR
MTNPAERRGAVRKPLHVRARLTAAGKSVEVRTFDISRSGLGIYAEFNPRNGLEVEVSCSLIKPGKEPQAFQARGRITHSVFTSDGRGFKLGMEFLHVDAASLQALSVFLL